MTRRELLLAPTALLAQPPRPNIVLILSDDQGYGDLSIHDNPVLKTPNLDRIAREGVQFTQFHVNPVCSPTRASLLTGRYYYRTGVVDTFLGRSMMHPDEVTLAEVLRGAGYRTGIFGKWHLGDHYPMRAIDQGFEQALTHDGGGIAQPSDPPEGNSYFNPKLNLNGRPVQPSGYCTDVFFNEAMRFIETNRSRPFFAYVTPNAPHTPLQVDERYVAPFRKAGVNEVTARVYGMETNLDENVGRLLAHLRKLNLEQNTILVFMTDNGPQQPRYNAGMRGLKGTVYQGGIRVPCFIRWPRVVSPGSTIDRLAAHIDLFPTLLDACGITPPPEPKIDGWSLLPLMRDSSTIRWRDRTLYFQWHRGEKGEMHRSCAARSQQYKLVNSAELYDLEADPAESRDIAAEHPGIVSRMRAGYEEWFRDVASTRNFEAPRIYIGAPRENPVLLTRQDWRGPRAGWAEDSLGHWDVDVRAAGDYEVELIFKADAAARPVKASLSGVEASTQAAPGATRLKLPLRKVPRGPARFEASIGDNGVHYANIRRLT